MDQFDKKSLSYRALNNHWRIFQKEIRKLSLNSFHSMTFRQTLITDEVVEKTLDFSAEESRCILWADRNGPSPFRTFLRHIINTLETDDSNAKLKTTNKLIKDIKPIGFGFRNSINFRKRVFITLNMKKKEDLSGPL